MTVAPRRRRRLGLALSTFGLAGLLLTVAAATLVLGSLGALAGVAASLDRQRADLVDLIEPAAAALNRSADSAANASVSLTASAAAASLGQVAASSRKLSGDLHTTAATISANVTDSAGVATDLRDLAGQLEAIGRSASAAGSASTLSASALDFGRAVLLGLLAWLAIPALIAIWLGIRLWRGWWPNGSALEPAAAPKGSAAGGPSPRGSDPPATSNQSIEAQRRDRP